MTNDQAYTLGEIIVEALRPMCQRIDIAGSVRRGRPVVNDLDLVLLPKPGQVEAVRERACARTRLVTYGPQTLIVALPVPRGYQHHEREIQIDIWFARDTTRDLIEEIPGNYGTLLMCRTGSREHNIRICQRAANLGLHWNPHQGLLKDNQVIASAAEEDIFAALGLSPIPPGFREADCLWDDYDLNRHRDRSATPAPPRKPVSDQDAARMFDRMKAICAQRGEETMRRCLEEAIPKNP